MRTVVAGPGRPEKGPGTGRKGSARERNCVWSSDFASRSPLPRRESGVPGDRGENRLDGRPRDRLASLFRRSQRSGAGASRKGGRSTITAARGRGVEFSTLELGET